MYLKPHPCSVLCPGRSLALWQVFLAGYSPIQPTLHPCPKLYFEVLRLKTLTALPLLFCGSPWWWWWWAFSFCFSVMNFLFWEHLAGWFRLWPVLCLRDFWRPWNMLNIVTAMHFHCDSVHVSPLDGMLQEDTEIIFLFFSLRGWQSSLFSEYMK